MVSRVWACVACSRFVSLLFISRLYLFFSFTDYLFSVLHTFHNVVTAEGNTRCAFARSGVLPWRYTILSQVRKNHRRTNDSFESSESYPFLTFLNDSNSNIRPARKTSELIWGPQCILKQWCFSVPISDVTIATGFCTFRGIAHNDRSAGNRWSLSSSQSMRSPRQHTYDAGSCVHKIGSNYHHNQNLLESRCFRRS